MHHLSPNYYGCITTLEHLALVANQEEMAIFLTAGFHNDDLLIISGKYDITVVNLQAIVP